MALNTQSAIDVLNYAAMYPCAEARYMSTGGELNPVQPDLIRSAIEKMPESAEIVLAVDNDEGGKKLSAKIQAIFDQISSAERVLRIHAPDHAGQDWNDALRASMAQADNVPQPQ
ncbi:MAG: toprim domain-containing protein [Verrucomicrobiota bacterium]